MLADLFFCGFLLIHDFYFRFPNILFVEVDLQNRQTKGIFYVINEIIFVCHYLIIFGKFTFDCSANWVKSKSKVGCP